MTLKEYYLQQQAIFQPALDAPKPDYLDIDKVREQEIEDYITNYTIANHHRMQVSNRLLTALQTLTDAQLKTVFGKIKGLQTNQRLTEAYFLKEIRSGRTQIHLNSALFGDSIDHMLDVYAEALGPEKVNEIINAPIEPHPLSPAYQAPKVYSPHEADIQALRDKYTHTDDPAKNAENEQLIEKVSKALQDVKPEVLKAYDQYRTNANIPDYENYDNMVGRRVEIYRNRGLQQLGGGQFQNAVKPGRGGDGSPDFEILNDAQYQNPLTAEQNQELDKLSTDPNVGLSEDTRQALRELSRSLDELHFEQVSGAPLSGQVFPIQRPNKPDDRYFRTEEGYKYYAFRPVITAKLQLLSAVKRGDLEQVRQAMAAYEQAEASTDRAFEILKSDKLNQNPLFSPNVESTRASTGDVPEKYALDTTKQKKLNGLYIAYGTLKSAGMTLEDLATDPVRVAKTLGKRLLAAGGMNSRPGSIGATLQNGLKGNLSVGTADMALLTAWVGLDAAMTRGMSGILGMEKDPKRGAEFMAAFHLGMREATKEIQKEVRRYKTMVGICTNKDKRYSGMRGALFQSAAILPESGENALNLEKMMDSFGRDDQVLVPGIRPVDAKPDQIRYSWQDQMDAANAYASGNAVYNWKELAGRNQKVLADAARERLISGSYQNQFDPDRYLLHAFSAQSRLAQNAAAKGENSPEFHAFRDSLKHTWELAGDPDVKAILKMGAVLSEKPDAYDFLKTGKSDQLIKSDSDEYRNMQKSLVKIQKVKELLTGGDPVKLETLYMSHFCTDLEQAKQNAFEYVRLKTKNGKKSSFHYQSGLQRAREGLENYRKLAKLQDELGLRSPAQKTYEDARMELLLHRGDPQWLYGQAGKRVMATMLYAKSFVDAKIPAEHQRGHFSPENLKKGVDSIVENRLHRFENPAELETLADEAVAHSGLFQKAAANLAARRRESYDRAMTEPRLKKARQDCAMGFAMDRACKELGITHEMQTYSPLNPAIREKAEAVQKDPDFREAMRRLTAGKTAEQIIALHPPGEPDPNPEGGEDFSKHMTAVKFEKHCAAVAAEATLRKNNPGREPTQEEIDKYATVIRTDRRFQSFMQEKESKLANEAAYRSAEDALNFQAGRAQFLAEMAQKVTEPIPQFPAPNEIQPQNLQNEPVVQGPGLGTHA